MVRWARALAFAILANGCNTRSPSTRSALPQPTDRAARAELSALELPSGRLELEACTDDVIRVSFTSKGRTLGQRSLATLPRRCPGVAWRRSEAAGEVVLQTSRLTLRVDRESGAVRFLDPGGAPVLEEWTRTLTPATVQGESTEHVQQQWRADPDEALYGLGQHQLGLLDLKGYDLDLHQYNTGVVVPFLVSSRGFGVLWDNSSFTRFGDLRVPEPIPAANLYGEGGKVLGVAAGKVSWQGELAVPSSGDYTFSTFSSGTIRVWVDGRLVIDHFRQSWLQDTDLARVRLEQGRNVKLAIEWTSDGVNVFDVRWKPPAASAPRTPPTTSLWSEVGDGVDYYVVYGPDLDHVVRGYRRLTGEATLPPRWAFGLWQSRERYRSAEELLGVLGEFRSRRIPLDVIVQDWRYWKDGDWGSHVFDATRFPDPAGFIRSIHEQRARLMISAWPKFYLSTDNYREFAQNPGFVYPLNVSEQRKDFLKQPFTYYDAFNPKARERYWSQLKARLFDLGVDGFWLDASEPEIVEGPFDSAAARLDAYRSHMHPTALGSGARMLNAYSLVNSQAVYEGQRRAAPERRVCILTRSAFAGQQRYGATTWSGDITSTWTAFERQIPAGLGFSLSGIPYWTTDAGGFSVPGRFKSGDPESVAEWRELQTRWFQFATFLPIMRVHGQSPPREMWHLGEEKDAAFSTHLKFDRLRYRLLPYVYSLAGAATHDSGTIVRPLVMDFRSDARARHVEDQYMFGQALMVSPVTVFQARSRDVYLPEGVAWYDFWTGQSIAGGQSIRAPAPYDALPLHVKAGAIVPFGPELQYTDERPADPITLYVYAGADGELVLYEDQGSSYDYERGAFSRIPVRWNDATRTLSIGERQGRFPGMLTRRTFGVVIVSRAKPTGFSFTAPKLDRTIDYDGSARELRL